MARFHGELAGILGAIAFVEPELSGRGARLGADRAGQPERRPDGGRGEAVLDRRDPVAGGQLGIEELAQRRGQVFIVAAVGGREISG
jgi:hypothetical protein